MPLIMMRMGSKGDHDDQDEHRGTIPVTEPQGETQGSIHDKPLPPSEKPTPVLLLIYTDGRLGRGETWPIFADCAEPGRVNLRFGGQELSDSRMSRSHARLRRDGHRWFLADLSSRNGTYVDGCLLRGEQEIVPGTLLRMGNTLLLFTERSVGARHAPPSYPGLIGDSPAMRAVREKIAKMASYASNVLITGETGVGKEVVARAIHRASGRIDTFMAVNCGGISEGVLESQLFGHARGAFTGAVSQQDGVFGKADKGTLLLDELGEMPLKLQVKLLRAIETRTIQPVGVAEEIPVDVRIIAATNCDVAAAVREGRLRGDLYARLAQCRIELPPLRQRREDIPLLIAHLLNRLGAAERTIEISLVEALSLHSWPFNVRGLLNMLQDAIITLPAEQPLAFSSEIERTLERERALDPAEDPEEGATPPPSGSRPKRKIIPEKSELEDALWRYRGHVADTARHFGCTRQQLYRWIDFYEIDLDNSRGPR
jgi:DNA-binding NtrC family response regulator